MCQANRGEASSSAARSWLLAVSAIAAACALQGLLDRHLTQGSRRDPAAHLCPMRPLISISRLEQKHHMQERAAGVATRGPGAAADVRPQGTRRGQPR